MIDHARLFRELARSKNFHSRWTNEVIFFTNDWMNNKHSKQTGWLRFQHYLLKKAWDLSAFNRNERTHYYIWQFLLEKLEKRNTKITAYTLDTVKHLIAIGLNALTGFKPNGTQQLSGPIHRIQEILVEDYGLKWYIPTIMEPSYFSKNKGKEFLYYTLPTPTLLESSPKRIITEIRKIKNLMELFYEEALDNTLKIGSTSIEWLINNITFDYFHSEEDVYKEIRLSKDMPKEDESLLYTPKKFKNSVFAESSPFVRGCVRIGKVIH
jgi:hypothetical protein